MRTAVLLICIYASSLLAETDSLEWSEPHHIEAFFSTGPMISLFREPRSPLSSTGAVLGFSAMGRIMWHPGRLISFGISTGYVYFSREDFSVVLPLLKDTVVPGVVTLSAIPLQVAASMQKSGFEIGAAVGPYLMMVDIVDEDHTTANRLELGLTAFASYEWSVGNWRIGPQLRTIVMSYRGIFSIVPEFRVHYDLLSY